MFIHKTKLFDFKNLSEFKSLNTNLDLDTNTVHIRPEDYENNKNQVNEEESVYSRTQPISVEDETLAHRVNATITILHLAAGGLQQINEIINEMLVLSNEAAKPHVEGQLRESICYDFNRLHAHIDMICESTRYKDPPPS